MCEDWGPVSFIILFISFYILAIKLIWKFGSFEKNINIKMEITQWENC